MIRVKKIVIFCDIDFESHAAMNEYKGSLANAVGVSAANIHQTYTEDPPENYQPQVEKNKQATEQ